MIRITPHFSARDVHWKSRDKMAESRFWMRPLVSHGNSSSCSNPAISAAAFNRFSNAEM